MSDDRPQIAARRQIADAVLMVRPSGIAFNPQTAADNFFQKQIGGLTETEIRARAMNEFDQFGEQLREAGIQVIIADSPDDLDAPDAVFPNNWISFHEDGTAVLYPMMAANRRRERRPEIIDQVRREGFALEAIVDYSSWENEGLALEGTGSMVLDRVNRLAFAALSPRTHEAAVRRWCDAQGYSPIVFRSRQLIGGQTRPIYHTNVLMGIGETWIVICSASIESTQDRNKVRDALASTGRMTVDIDEHQMWQFAGNVLQLSSRDAVPITVISQAALECLSAEQRHGLSRGTKLLSADIATIEACGGGSVRCMLAEIFLPRIEP